MKFYLDLLRQKGFKAHYFEEKALGENPRILNKYLLDLQVDEVRYFDVVDDWLEQKIRKHYASGFKCTVEETPTFNSSPQLLEEEFSGKKHCSMASFYSK